MLVYIQEKSRDFSCLWSLQLPKIYKLTFIFMTQLIYKKDDVMQTTGDLCECYLVGSNTVSEEIPCQLILLLAYWIYNGELIE